MSILNVNRLNCEDYQCTREIIKLLFKFRMNAKRIQDAEKLVKKGEEHLKTTMFKWTPDVDSAIECFDKGFF